MTDLRSLVADIISNSFNNIDGLSEELTYIFIDRGTYDPVTEEEVIKDREYKLNGVFDDLEEENAIKRLLRAPVTTSTLSVIIAANDIPITPRNSDKIIRKSTNQTFTIHKVTTDPFTSAWVLRLDE